MRKTVLPAAAAGAVAGALRSRLAKDDIAGEVAIVTGASRGLGFLLARELARHSCRLVVCASDGAELGDAAARLEAAGADVVAVECDVAEPGAGQRLVDTAVERYGRLDILINNAGIIRVGPVETARGADFESALGTMALAPVRTTLAALPVMRRQAHGRIVTITSIGGKVSVPHLLPYSVAKFAAVAFSEGLRAELGAGPVTVTTVVPGLMRTGSHVQARFAGQREKEFTWFSLGASLPLLSMDAERAARRIVAAMRARRSELVLTPLAQVAARGAAISPELTVRLLHLTHRLLPAAAGQAAAAPGHELRPAVNRVAFDRLTALGRSAARRFNELPRSS
jgi:NAD(P)-dependent dehydrogenase (short-subunit alcohol dehydrogenase family)